MKIIYENATQVLIWLGPKDDTNQQVLLFLEELGKQASEIGIFSLDLAAPERLRTGTFSWPPPKMSLSRVIAQRPRLSRFSSVSLVN
jgi:hypothetical protein